MEGDCLTFLGHGSGVGSLDSVSLSCTLYIYVWFCAWTDLFTTFLPRFVLH